MVVTNLLQRFNLQNQADITGCDILCVPGEANSDNFRLVVTISQNLHLFEWVGILRYGWSIMTLRFLLLHWLQSQSFCHADGLIFLTQYEKQKVSHCLSDAQTISVIIPHSSSNRFLMKPKVKKSIADFSKTNPFRILYVSPIDQNKHQWNVVEAVSILRQYGFPIVLDLFGAALPRA